MSDIHGAADPSLKLPAAVIRNAARSAELSEKQRLLRSAPPIQPANGDAPPANDATPPANGDAPPANDATPPATPESKAAEMEHQYKSMKGRLDVSERNNRTLQQQISDMQRLIATMQSAPPPPPAAPPAGKKLVTAEEEAAYGPEMMDVVRRLAQEVYEPQLAELRGHISQLGGQVKGVSKTVQLSAQDQMMADLGRQFPNLEEINHDNDFIAWLGLPDPYSGAIRQTLMNQAVAAAETGRVAAFIKGYIADKAATSPADLTRPAPGAKEPPSSLLESLAAPGRASGSGSSALPADKPIITRAQITAFYNDLAKGVYNGRDVEKNEVERLIFAAQNEGRIR